MTTNVCAQKHDVAMSIRSKSVRPEVLSAVSRPQVPQGILGNRSVRNIGEIND